MHLTSCRLPDLQLCREAFLDRVGIVSPSRSPVEMAPTQSQAHDVEKRYV